MGRVGRKNLIAIKLAVLAFSLPAINATAFAESLFTMGVTHNAYPVNPRSLYSSVKAKTVGDLVTVIIDENFKTSDDLALDIDRSSSVDDGFRTLVNKILPGKIVPDGIGNFGGEHEVGSSASVARTTTFTNTITAQVVQILPNGNLVIQGKKVAINAGEQVNVIISGIVDPRFLDGLGRIQSNQIANLQFAMSGKGTISRSNTDGTVNKFIRYLF